MAAEIGAATVILSAKPSDEDVLKRLAQLEDVVQRSGLFDGIDAPEFSADGATWSQTWSHEDEPPAYGRVSIYRKDVRRPYAQPLAWADLIPADDEWRELWFRKPMPLFGAALKRDAFRHMFRDVVGDYRDPSEDASELPAKDVEPSAPRDWAAEIAAATTSEQIDELGDAIRFVKGFTSDKPGTALHRAWMAKKRELAADAWSPEPAAVKEPAHEVRQPQDHQPPANRAARRAAARKKGGKR